MISSMPPPIHWGDLRRLSPVSAVWGLDRGRPLDRYYIENFLDRHRTDISGRVLEVKDPGYTQRYGRDLTRVDVLDIDAGNRGATIVADLATGSAFPVGVFDCFVFTQTLHLIYEVEAALSNARRLLRAGGVLLCTLPSVIRIDYEYGGPAGGDFWRFTDASVRRLFTDVFGTSFEMEVWGNVMVCAAFLYGLAPEELTRDELDFVDPWFPLLYCVRAINTGDAR